MSLSCRRWVISRLSSTCFNLGFLAEVVAWLEEATGAYHETFGNERDFELGVEESLGELKFENFEQSEKMGNARRKGDIASIKKLVKEVVGVSC